MPTVTAANLIVSDPPSNAGSGTALTDFAPAASSVPLGTFLFVNGHRNTSVGYDWAYDTLYLCARGTGSPYAQEWRQIDWMD
jgi:hypothetical protein